METANDEPAVHMFDVRTFEQVDGPGGAWYATVRNERTGVVWEGTGRTERDALAAAMDQVPPPA